MKLCRYDDDRLGVVIGDQVHDVTEAQTEIRVATPYTAKVDPVVAALPQWRGRLEQMAKAAPSKPLAGVKLLSPVKNASFDSGILTVRVVCPAAKERLPVRAPEKCTPLRAVPSRI